LNYYVWIHDFKYAVWFT